jgi:hypothetical protein
LDKEEVRSVTQDPASPQGEHFETSGDISQAGGKPLVAEDYTGLGQTGVGDKLENNGEGTRGQLQEQSSNYQMMMNENIAVDKRKVPLWKRRS